MLNNEQKKELTEYLGGCFHEWEWIPGGGLKCKNCPIDLYEEGTWQQIRPVPQPRTFTTDQDFLALCRKAVEKGEWKSFYMWAWKKSGLTWAEDFCSWLFLYENTARSCELFWEWRQKCKR